MPEASKPRPIGSSIPPRAPLIQRGIAQLCLFAQLMALVHLGLVRHATCLEHDALVHSQIDAGADADGPAGAGANGDSGAVPATAAAEAGGPVGKADGVVPDSAIHSDDHCLAAGSRRRDLAAVRSPVILALAAPAEPTPPDHRRGELPPAPVALLRFAPKSSPPLPASG